MTHLQGLSLNHSIKPQLAMHNSMQSVCLGTYLVSGQ
jgi:hypothetical protein